jgi:uroporphyrinogen III methyltransferase / synthase
MQSPSIEILGQRSDEIQSKILSGRAFLITRTSEGNALERKILESLGAKVVGLPSISIGPPTSWKKMDNAISKLDQFDWVVFTSASGVKIFFERIKRNDPQLLGRLRKQDREKLPRFACVGPSTKHALEGLGLRCFLQPKEFTTMNLGKELARRMNVKGKKILLARAEVANKQITRILRDSGATVSEVSVYRTITQSKNLPPNFLEKITDITLTSPSTVRGLLRSVGAAEINSKKILIHCIGPVTARCAKKRGLNIENVAKVHTMDGLVNTIVSLD